MSVTLLALTLSIPLSSAAALLPRTPAPVIPDSAARVTVEAAAELAGLRPSVLRPALDAYRRAVLDGAATRALLTVIDYSLPSHERRLWVLDLARGTVLAREFVAHGLASGGDRAYKFSNRPDSFASSLGTFVTAGMYQGKNGLSLRLDGLDPGLNDHALDRGIVMHGAWYVSRDMIRKFGRLGRSEGCPALNPDAAPRIIHLIAGGSVVFAYYPAPALERTLGHR